MTPLVSIGMPAYNAERTIRDSVECLLAQQDCDLELIISDNASTDGTWAIIQELAARDARVVAMRQVQNIGANGNYSAVFRMARGRYFKWASSSDWCAPDFVRECCATLDARPEVVLAAPRTRLFSGTVEAGYDYDGDMSFEDDDPVQRFSDVTTRLKLNNVLNGLVRTEALRRTRLIEHYRGADVVLIAHLALLGKIVLLERTLFGRRMDHDTATALMPAEAIRRHHYPRRSWRALFPSIRNVAGCVRAALATDLSMSDKLRALAWVARLARWRGPEMRRELAEAVRYPLR